jgi:hypothetical protein
MTASKARSAVDIRDTDIVVGVDGSSSARAALRWALKQARLTGARGMHRRGDQLRPAPSTVLS